MKRRKKKKEWKLENFVLFSLATVIIYAIAEFVAGFFGVTHDTLTTCFISVFGGEVLTCALIKVFKLKEDNEGINADEDNDDA